MYMNKSRWLCCLIALSILAALPSTVPASFSGSSRTYLPASEALNEDSHVSLYEYLDLELSGTKMKGVPFCGQRLASARTFSFAFTSGMS
jgi:hypothetical protein